ncbi:MAG: type II toxin-antitoxin system HicA family toxin [bacterium]|nr:type II toxin-antitoxin system HicA family toxin [bacterium]MBK8127678.1 type II toxin-antitoxin system HicA family toxin [bacterium]
MTKLPVVDFRTFEKVLKRLGFDPVRQRGSHVVFKHPDGRGTAVPNHPGRDLTRPLIRDILNEISVSIDDYLRAISEV